MNLSPRAIALQGIGYTPRLVALQGLWDVAGSGAVFMGGPQAVPYPRGSRRRRDEEVIWLAAAALVLLEDNR